MIAAQGILTSCAAARPATRRLWRAAWARPASAGLTNWKWTFAVASSSTAPGGVTVGEGDVISIDGTSGIVYLGEVAVVPSPVVQMYFEGSLDPNSDELVAAVHRLMTACGRQAAARRPGER